MQHILRIILIVTVISQTAFANKEYATLNYGEHLDIPEGKVAIFVNANFNMSQYDTSVYTEIALWGVTTNEELELLPLTSINQLMPTFEVGTNGPGTSGSPESGVSFMMQGPVRFKLAAHSGDPVFDAQEVKAQALVCIEDAISFECEDSTIDTIPQAAVVIPSDAAGPVEILLESSLDMINWVSATPGTYGASQEKRFFRVRAVQSF